MKKQTFTITSLGLLALLSCGLVFHLSCTNKCTPDCGFTQPEQNFFSCFNNAEKIIFKNDVTNAIDTIKIPGGYELGCPGPCTNCPDYDQKVYGCLFGSVTFSPIGKINYTISHAQTPSIGIGSDTDGYGYILNVPTQIVSINGTTYNDVYSVLSSPDSTTINANGDKLKVPWKIYYSKSQGFVRFYMLNGQTISKL